jgi:lipopolysaccharide transport system permease protein
MTAASAPDTRAQPRSDVLRQLLFFTRNDLQQRFVGNALGAVWTVLAPVLQLALFAFVFVQIFRQRMPELGPGGYVAFLALGMWPWFAFSEGVHRGATALIEHAGLLSKVAIPPWQLVCARVLSAFAVHAAGFVVVVALLAVFGDALRVQGLPLALLGWIPLLLLALLIAPGLAVSLVFIRDLAQILPYLLSALMFLSPIVYALAMAPPFLQPWLELNPIAVAVELIRGALLVNGTLAWPGVATLLVAVGAGALSVLLYRRLRGHVVDFL